LHLFFFDAKLLRYDLLHALFNATHFICYS
jgi:hypothetical protein